MCPCISSHDKLWHKISVQNVLFILVALSHAGRQVCPHLFSGDAKYQAKKSKASHNGYAMSVIPFPQTPYNNP
ncbi:hypothetical protein FJTKL_13323 [Diaporthe vaccinii]|uniref:Uncharacterized protein n=1 Tax=Diaporthe vaccinii TaxID=105482 RepID=A0ABR4EBE0_9PEZI